MTSTHKQVCDVEDVICYRVMWLSLYCFVYDKYSGWRWIIDDFFILSISLEICKKKTLFLYVFDALGWFVKLAMIDIIKFWFSGIITNMSGVISI